MVLAHEEDVDAQLVGAHLARPPPEEPELETPARVERTLWQRAVTYLSSGDGENPSFFDVVGASVNIMQDRITRSRMAGDPAEITLAPALDDYALMDFHRAGQAIAAIDPGMGVMAALRASCHC